MTIDEIKALTVPERLAGFILVNAKLAVLGARLRKNNRKDNVWTPEEEDEWDAVVDETDNWFYALSAEERAMLDPAESILASLTRGELPGS